MGRLLPVDGSGNVSGGFVVDCNPGSGPYAGRANGNAYLSIRGMTSGETAQSARGQLAFNCAN